MPKQISVDELLAATEIVDIDSIQQHPQNPNLGDEEKIKKSIEHHGQFRAIGISTDNYILFGNHTWLGDKLAGAKRILVHRLPFLHTDPQAIKILLADNRARDGSEYDMGILQMVLEEVREADGDLEGSLFDDDFLLKLIAKDQQATYEDVDDIPAVPKQPITEKGDVWICGKHILVCGDATDPAVYDQLFKLDSADIIWTDPPYGISYLQDFDEAKAMNHRTDKLVIGNDEKTDDELVSFLKDAMSLSAARTRKGAAVYCCAPPGPTSMLFAFVLQEMEILHQILVWAKDKLIFGRSDYHYQHELIMYGWLPGAAHFFTDDRTQNSLWQIERPRRSDEHPTMKPVELVTRALMNSSKAGQTVLDPFSGSGTTLIAAQMTHRSARCIEIDPGYCDVTLRRFQEQTGVLPVHAGNGEQYDFVNAENSRSLTEAST